MTFETLKQKLPDYAKDIKLNLSTVLNESGAPGLTKQQIAATALASAYATRNKEVIAAIQGEVSNALTATEINAAKGAATIMAMNNIYYRFAHTINDAAFHTMPANLRMNVMANPGANKVDFELASLAVSAINGCAKCINAHAATLQKHGVSKEAIQSSVRIASVMNGFAQGLEIM